MSHNLMKFFIKKNPMLNIFINVIFELYNLNFNNLKQNLQASASFLV
jgi:hypothetical protein